MSQSLAKGYKISHGNGEGDDIGDGNLPNKKQDDDYQYCETQEGEEIGERIGVYGEDRIKG